MSNHNKTLADVQPGGRVRLGDRPTIEKRARELLASAYADTGAPALLVDEVRGGKHDTASDNAALRAIVAALSAQPSPGGQDALTAQQIYDRFGFLEGLVTEVTYRRIADEASRIQQIALAARQPAKQPDSVALGEATEFCIEKGDRQQVGEPVACVRDLLPQEVLSAISACAVIAKKESAHPVQKYVDTINAWLYAAPPAQAVDLGELRRLSDGWLARSDRLSITQQRKAGAYWACAKELRDWLDSQAVGK